MKKFFMITAVVLVAVVALGVASFAYAQTQNPPTSPAPNGAPGSGMMGGSGMVGPGMMGRRGGGGMIGNGTYGPMHEYRIAALAEALGLTSEDLQARIEAGETPYEIAQSQGLSDEEILDLMEKAHDQALKAAVEAGVITQEQADWMDEHMQQMWQNGVPGSGPCHGGRTPNGTGSGSRWRLNNQDGSL